MPPYRTSGGELSLEDELMRRINESKVDLSKSAVKEYADSLISTTKAKMEHLLTGLTRSEGTITIKLDNFRTLLSQLQYGTTRKSEVTYVAGLPWQVYYSFWLVDDNNYTMDLFVFHSDKDTKQCEAEVDFVMKDQRGGRDFVRSLSHTFKPNGQFGFRYFVYKSEIENPKFGYLQDDSLIIEVTVRVVQSTAEPAAGINN